MIRHPEFLHSLPALPPASLPPQPSHDTVRMRVYVGERCYLVTPDTLIQVLDQIRQDRAA